MSVIVDEKLDTVMSAAIVARERYLQEVNRGWLPEYRSRIRFAFERGFAGDTVPDPSAGRRRRPNRTLVAAHEAGRQLRQTMETENPEWFR